MNANRAHGGIPIGAVKISAHHVQKFRHLVTNTLGATKFRGVEKYHVGPPNPNGTNQPAAAASSTTKSDAQFSPPALLIYLAPNVAAALDDGHPELTEFLKRNNGVYVPGLRRPRTHHAVKRRRKNANLPKVGSVVVRSAASATAKRKSSHVVDSIGGGSTMASPLTVTEFTFAELFAGIGGFRLGLEAIGGKCVMANEIDPYAAAIYRQNFGNTKESSRDCHLIEADILDICENTDVPADTTILTAGFPCQPFTNRGDQRGLDDDRGQLYRELVRVLKASRPRSFLFENVGGLVALGGGSVQRREAGPVLQTILEAFRGCGYNVTWQICNSRHYVPQRRERVFIVGIRKDLKKQFSWKWYEQMRLGGSSKNADRCPMTIRDIMEPPNSPAVLENGLSPIQWAKLKEVYPNGEGNVKAEAGLDIDAKAPTLISSYRRPGNLTSKFIFTEKDGTERRVPRYLTPRECCRIQGFPEDYDLSTIGRLCGDKNAVRFYSGIGNAVVPPVVSSIGKEVIDCLRS